MSRRGWLLFLTMGLIWGVPYLFIKIAVGELHPATLVLGRTFLGAAVLLPIAFARREVVAVLRHWRPVLAYTGVEICIPWLMLGYAEQRISSSLTGLLIAGVPLIAALVAWLVLREPLGPRRGIGLGIGALGVGALVGFDVGGGNAVAIAAMATVAVCYAVGPVIQAKFLPDVPKLGFSACTLSLAALAYLPFGLVATPGGPGALTGLAPSTWGAVAVLALVCTALAFVVFVALVSEVGPARASVITYVNPVVATALGVTILGEPLTVTMGLGFALILAGSVLATSRERDAATTGQAQAPGSCDEPLTEAVQPARKI